MNEGSAKMMRNSFIDGLSGVCPVIFAFKILSWKGKYRYPNPFYSEKVIRYELLVKQYHAAVRPMRVLDAGRERSRIYTDM